MYYGIDELLLLKLLKERTKVTCLSAIFLFLLNGTFFVSVLTFGEEYMQKALTFDPSVFL